MDSEVKERWVAALRSGEYEQGTGQLREAKTERGFTSCCLDVLCALAVEDGIIDPPKLEHETDLYTDEDREAIAAGMTPAPTQYVYWDEAEQKWEFEILPKVVYRWAGLTHKSPAVMVSEDADEPEVAAHDLTTLNDDWGWSFEQIADAIEADADL